MRYLVDDAALDPAAFLALANSVWPGEYDLEKTRQALGRTLNITAYHQGRLIGCLRILTDGCYFGTITEVLVLPAFQKQGVGSQLLSLARAHTPTLLYFGAKPGAEGFYEKTAVKKGCRPISSTRRKHGGSGAAMQLIMVVARRRYSGFLQRPCSLGFRLAPFATGNARLRPSKASNRIWRRVRKIRNMPCVARVSLHGSLAAP